MHHATPSNESRKAFDDSVEKIFKMLTTVEGIMPNDKLSQVRAAVLKNVAEVIGLVGERFDTDTYISRPSIFRKKSGRPKSWAGLLLARRCGLR